MTTRLRYGAAPLVLTVLTVLAALINSRGPVTGTTAKRHPIAGGPWVTEYSHQNWAAWAVIISMAVVAVLGVIAAVLYLREQTRPAVALLAGAAVCGLPTIAPAILAGLALLIIVKRSHPAR